MIDIGKLSPIGAGNMLILQLRSHGGSVLFTLRRQFRRSGLHLHAARSTIETHAATTTAVIATTVIATAIINITHDSNVHIVVGAVVVEMTVAPVAALVAETDIAEAIIDAAVVADVRTPVATIKAVAVVPVTPVAGRPERALIGSLNPPAGHPIVASRRISPVAGRPEVTVAGGRRLIVIRQRRRRLRSIVNRLSAVVGVIRTTVRGLAVMSARVGLRGALRAGAGGAVRCGRGGV